MHVQFTFDQKTWQVQLDHSHSLAILQSFDKSQPNHFEADLATKIPVPVGDSVGDTRKGFSCNFSQIRLVPHCNGTHTECVGHIVDPRVNLEECDVPAFMLAALVTIEPELAQYCSDRYRPSLANEDLVITRRLCENVFKQPPMAEHAHLIRALIIRTLPNETTKKSLRYGRNCPAPFFSCDAIEFLNDKQIQHLLVDFPSIDRMDDDGLLTNHHLYWNVAESTHELNNEVYKEKTITEMIFVESDVTDGAYILNLQFPAMATNAVPSKPIIFKAEAV